MGETAMREISDMAMWLLIVLFLITLTTFVWILWAMWSVHETQWIISHLILEYLDQCLWSLGLWPKDGSQAGSDRKTMLYANITIQLTLESCSEKISQSFLLFTNQILQHLAENPSVTWYWLIKLGRCQHGQIGWQALVNSNTTQTTWHYNVRF